MRIAQHRVDQLSQRDRTEGCVSFRRNISGSPLTTSVIAEHRTACSLLVIAQVPVINALVLSNICEYRKSYIAKS